MDAIRRHRPSTYVGFDRQVLFFAGCPCFCRFLLKAFGDEEKVGVKTEARFIHFDTLE